MMNLKQYQSLLRASPYAYLVMTPELVIVAASQTYLRVVQRSEEELIGRYVFDAFPLDPGRPDATNMAEVKASMLRALAKRQADTTTFVRYAVPVETAEGRKFEQRYWSTVHTPLLNDSGEPELLIQNPVDVTELYLFDETAGVATLQLSAARPDGEDFNRAQMHEALARILNNEREHLRSLFNQAPGFVAVLMGPKHVFEMVNEAYYQLVGHRELLGKTVWEALPEVAGQGYEEHLDSVYQTGQEWSTRAMPISIQRQRGGALEQRYIDLVYQPYKDQYGTTIGIFAQGYDVTESVQAQAAQRESEERLRDGMDAARMVVWDWDVATGDLAYSDNITLVLGCSPATMPLLHQYIHPEDRQQVASAHLAALSETGAYHAVVRFIRPDNQKVLWVDSRGRVQYGVDGKPERMRGVTMDVTERYRAELEVRETSRKKDEFLAMLAHELRNPLAPIATAAEMLKLTASGDARTKRASEVISRQVGHMTTLIDDLLDVSRVTRGLVELDRRIIDVREAVASAVEQIRPLIEERRHALVVHADVPAVVDGDRIRLVQVIANLLNNAAKYTPQGGTITLELSVVDAMVWIRVADNGIGIDPQLVPHIFELFTQAERTPDRAQGGLGIGLALVNSIVALHGGLVEAHSGGAGLGSEFRVGLPAVARAPMADRRHDALTGAVGGAGIVPLSLMIVDDNGDAAQSLAELLRTYGHKVAVHSHPDDAIAAAANDPPQVFILDIGLPGMDGYTLARRLRGWPGTGKALYIALTGYGQAHDRILSRSSGFHHHFVKPLDIEELNRALAGMRER
jgi:PAS domain S-box-containing protein